MSYPIVDMAQEHYGTSRQTFMEAFVFSFWKIEQVVLVQGFKLQGSSDIIWAESKVKSECL